MIQIIFTEPLRLAFSNSLYMYMCLQCLAYRTAIIMPGWLHYCNNYINNCVRGTLLFTSDSISSVCDDKNRNSDAQPGVCRPGSQSPSSAGEKRVLSAKVRFPSKDEFKYSKNRAFEHFLVQFNYFLSSTKSNFNRTPSFQAKIAF